MYKGGSVSRMKILILVLPLIATLLRCTRYEEELDVINISNTRGYSEYPAIAADSRGYFYVVWDEQFITYESLFIYIAIREPSGEWSAPEKFFELQWATFPDIEIDQHNTIHVIWRDTDEQGWGEVLYTKKKTCCMWTEPETISVYGMSCNPDLAVDNLGNVHLVWLEWPTYRVQKIFYAKRTSGGYWSVPIEISEGNVFLRGFPHIAVTPKGDVHIVWEVTRTDTGPTLSMYAMSNDGITFTNPAPIHYTGGRKQEQISQSITTDYEGVVHVVWTDRGDIFYTWKVNDEDWEGPIIILDTEVYANRPDITAGADARLHLVWDEENTYLCHTSKPLDGDWTNPTRHAIDMYGFPSPKAAISSNCIGVVFTGCTEIDPSGKNNTEVFFVEIPIY